jgi:hypothetical protein
MKLESIELKHLGEKWVQKQIADDPTLLGLGDLILKDKANAKDWIPSDNVNFHFVVP